MDQKILQNLNNSKNIANLQALINDIIIHDNIGDAKMLLPELEKIFVANPDFEKADKALFEVFENFLISLRFVIIFELPDKDIISLLNNYFDFIFEHPDYDFNRKIKYKISSIGSLEERDEFKEKLRQVILNSKTILGHDKILVSGIEQEPTVAAWIKDYYIKVGLEPVDALKLSEYIVNNTNTKSLSPEYREKLKVLLNIFENIKVSSSESPVFEESFVAILPNNELALISGGQPTRISQEVHRLAQSVLDMENTPRAINDKDDDLFLPDKPAATEKVSESALSLAELEQALTMYPQGSLEHKAISQEISRLKRSEFKQSQKIDAKL